MTVHNDAQSRPVDPPTEPPPKDEFFPPPPKRTPPPSSSRAESPPAPPQLDVRATFDSLKLVETLRDSVVRELVDRDAARLTDAVGGRLGPQVREQAKAVVAAEFADRVRLLGSIGSVVSLVLGFVGYKTLSASATSAAEAEAKRVAAAAVADQVKEMSDRVKSERERLESNVRAAQDSIVSLRVGMSEAAAKTLVEFREDVGKQLDQLSDDARKAANEQVDIAARTITNQQASFTSEIARLRAEIRRELKPPQDSTSSRAVRGSEDGLERVLELDTERRFEIDQILEVAKEFDSKDDAEAQRSVFDPVYNYPAGFSDDARERACDVLLSQDVPALLRRSTAIELMIAALRVRDEALFARAETDYDNNLYTRSQNTDPFVELIKLAWFKPNSHEARQAFPRVQHGSLTLRGKLNLVLLGKMAGVTADVESLTGEVLDQLFISRDGSVAYIDRYTDYSSAAHVLDVLLRAPVVEKERVTEAVQRIKGLIFKSDNDPDPFELRKRIDEFLGT